MLHKSNEKENATDMCAMTALFFRLSLSLLFLSPFFFFVCVCVCVCGANQGHRSHNLDKATDVTCHNSLSKNHPSGHLEGWATSWPAEEMLDGQHQRVDIPAHARTVHKGLLQKRLEEDLSRIVPHVPPTTQSIKELNWSCHLNYLHT